MKNLSLILLLSAFTVSNLYASKEVGNGGDREAQSFANHAIIVTNYYVNLCSNSWSGRRILEDEIPGATCDDFRAIKNITRKAAVKFKEIVYGDDGQERDAINNGTNIITVSAKRWKAMRSLTVNERIRIALHEYASLAGIESSDAYGFSGSVASSLPANGKVQYAIDRIRYTQEYLLQMSDLELFQLIQGKAQSNNPEERNRVPFLFGGCSTGKESSHIWVSLDGHNIKEIVHWDANARSGTELRENYFRAANSAGSFLRELIGSGRCGI